MFQGHLTNQTKCLWCENVAARRGVSRPPSTSRKLLSSCLRAFSERAPGARQVPVRRVRGFQEAHKRMLVNNARVLALHLKVQVRRGAGEAQQAMHRVAFPASSARRPLGGRARRSTTPPTASSRSSCTSAGNHGRIVPRAVARQWLTSRRRRVPRGGDDLRGYAETQGGAGRARVHPVLPEEG